MELGKVPGPEGKLLHAVIRIGDSPVMLVDEFPSHNSFGPKSLKGSPVTIHLYVQNVEAVFNQAVAAGAKIMMPVADMFWGDRYGLLEDPFGHHWLIATHVRDVNPEEIEGGGTKGLRLTVRLLSECSLIHSPRARRKGHNAYSITNCNELRLVFGSTTKPKRRQSSSGDIAFFALYQSRTLGKFPGGLIRTHLVA